jgi:hypothetical protein
VKGPCREGRPIKKNAIAKLRGMIYRQCKMLSNFLRSGTYNVQGKVKTQRDGLIRKRIYQKSEATKKIAPIMYKSVFVCVLLPVNKVNWKDV